MAADKKFMMRLNRVQEITPVRVALIGYGFRARGIHSVLRELDMMYDVAAVADLDADNLADAAAADVPFTTTDYREILAMDDVQAVYVITPQFVHKDIVLDCLAAGKDIYCEKPMALNLGDCRAMQTAAKKADRILFVGLQMRYHKHLQKIAELIAAGAIGTPMMAWLSEFRNPFPSTMRWVFDRSKGGGMLVDKSCHHFDVFNWFLNAKPVRVYASGDAAVHKEIFGLKSDIADHAFVTVEYDNGSRASLTLCMFAGAPHTHEYGIGTWVRSLGVQGTTGSLESEGYRLGHNKVEQRFVDSRNCVTHELSDTGALVTPYNQNGNRGVHYEFYECLVNRRKPFTDAENGYQSLLVSLAATRSLHEKRIVDLDEIVREQDRKGGSNA